ncbi:hypothetical protein AB0K89_26290 [Streptomyces cinnamoneus]|uniref:hypothetical protein n=1 Tax=Streptomyces cinnamoneus TaxID=53446 RepID=UPI0034340B57
MDIHALAHAGSRLHRAARSLTSALESRAGCNSLLCDGDEVAVTGLDQAHLLVEQARDHVLVTYALGQLRIGPPEDRPARLRDAYDALADATDRLLEVDEIQRCDIEAAGVRLAEACRDISAAVMLLAPTLGPEIAAGVGQTPVRLATELQLVAEAAGTRVPSSG